MPPKNLEVSGGEAAPSYEVDGLKFRAAVSEMPKHGEDSHVFRPEIALFGVFDGMGGGPYGAAASGVGRKITEELFAGDPALIEADAIIEKLNEAFAATREYITANMSRDATTAVVAKLHRNGDRLQMIWANSGDSRILVFRPEEGLLQICTDQSDGNALLNALGKAQAGWPSLKDEFGIFDLQPGDKIMLCSDGITGDWPEQKLTAQEFEWAFSAPDAQTISSRFIELSKKSDDKTAVIVVVD